MLVCFLGPELAKIVITHEGSLFILLTCYFKIKAIFIIFGVGLVMVECQRPRPPPRPPRPCPESEIIDCTCEDGSIKENPMECGRNNKPTSCKCEDDSTWVPEGRPGGDRKRPCFDSGIVNCTCEDELERPTCTTHL